MTCTLRPNNQNKGSNEITTVRWRRLSVKDYLLMLVNLVTNWHILHGNKRPKKVIKEEKKPKDIKQILHGFIPHE